MTRRREIFFGVRKLCAASVPATESEKLNDTASPCARAIVAASEIARVTEVLLGESAGRTRGAAAGIGAKICLPGFHRFKFQFHSFFAETFSTVSVECALDYPVDMMRM
jgi:hypothetical protein